MIQDYRTGRLDRGFLVKRIADSVERVDNEQPKDSLSAKRYTLNAFEIPDILKPAARHAQTLESIKGTELFDELEKLEDELRSALPKSDEERRILQGYKELELLKSFAKLEITHREWRSIAECGMPNADCSIGLIRTPHSEIRTLFVNHFTFYELALRRDEALLENSLKIMDKEKARVSVITTGGFHSEGIKQRLKEGNIPFVLISPRINEIGTKDNYLNAMQNKRSFMKYYKGSLWDALAQDYAQKIITQGQVARGKGQGANLDPGSMTLDPHEITPQLKRWRDRIIQNSIAEGRITQATNYTKYVDALIQSLRSAYVDERTADSENTIQKELDAFLDLYFGKLRNIAKQKIENLSEGLKELFTQKEISAKSVEKLLNTINLPAKSNLQMPVVLADGPASRAELRTIDIQAEVAALKAAGISLAGAEKFVAESRAELRSETLAVSRQQLESLKEQMRGLVASTNKEMSDLKSKSVMEKSGDVRSHIRKALAAYQTLKQKADGLQRKSALIIGDLYRRLANLDPVSVEKLISVLVAMDSEIEWMWIRIMQKEEEVMKHFEEWLELLPKMQGRAKNTMSLIQIRRADFVTLRDQVRSLKVDDPTRKLRLEELNQLRDSITETIKRLDDLEAYLEAQDKKDAEQIAKETMALLDEPVIPEPLASQSDFLSQYLKGFKFDFLADLTQGFTSFYFMDLFDVARFDSIIEDFLAYDRAIQRVEWIEQMAAEQYGLRLMRNRFESVGEEIIDDAKYETMNYEQIEAIKEAYTWFLALAERAFQDREKIQLKRHNQRQLLHLRMQEDVTFSYSDGRLSAETQVPKSVEIVIRSNGVAETKPLPDLVSEFNVTTLELQRAGIQQSLDYLEGEWNNQEEIEELKARLGRIQFLLKSNKPRSELRTQPEAAKSELRGDERSQVAINFLQEIFGSSYTSSLEQMPALKADDRFIFFIIFSDPQIQSLFRKLASENYLGIDTLKMALEIDPMNLASLIETISFNENNFETLAKEDFIGIESLKRALEKSPEGVKSLIRIFNGMERDKKEIERLFGNLKFLKSKFGNDLFKRVFENNPDGFSEGVNNIVWDDRYLRKFRTLSSDKFLGIESMKKAFEKNPKVLSQTVSWFDNKSLTMFGSEKSIGLDLMRKTFADKPLQFTNAISAIRHNEMLSESISAGHFPDIVWLREMLKTDPEEITRVLNKVRHDLSKMLGADKEGYQEEKKAIGIFFAQFGEINFSLIYYLDSIFENNVDWVLGFLEKPEILIKALQELQKYRLEQKKSTPETTVFQILSTPLIFQEADHAVRRLFLDIDSLSIGSQSYIKGIILLEAWQDQNHKVRDDFLNHIYTRVIPALRVIEHVAKIYPTLGIETTQKSESSLHMLSQITLANYLRLTPSVDIAEGENKNPNFFDEWGSSNLDAKAIRSYFDGEEDFYELRANPTVYPIFLLQLKQWEELGLIDPSIYSQTLGGDHLEEAPFIQQVAFLLSIPVGFLSSAAIEHYLGGNPEGEWVFGGVSGRFKGATVDPWSLEIVDKHDPITQGTQTNFFFAPLKLTIDEQLKVGITRASRNLQSDQDLKNPFLRSISRMIERGQYNPGSNEINLYQNDLRNLFLLVSASAAFRGSFGLTNPELKTAYKEFKEKTMGKLKEVIGEEDLQSITPDLRSEKNLTIYDKRLRKALYTTAKFFNKNPGKHLQFQEEVEGELRHFERLLFPSDLEGILVRRALEGDFDAIHQFLVNDIYFGAASQELRSRGQRLLEIARYPNLNLKSGIKEDEQATSQEQESRSELRAGNLQDLQTAYPDYHELLEELGRDASLGIKILIQAHQTDAKGFLQSLQVISREKGYFEQIFEVDPATTRARFGSMPAAFAKVFESASIQHRVAQIARDSKDSVDLIDRFIEHLELSGRELQENLKLLRELAAINSQKFSMDVHDNPQARRQRQTEIIDQLIAEFDPSSTEALKEILESRGGLAGIINAIDFVIELEESDELDLGEPDDSSLSEPSAQSELPLSSITPAVSLEGVRDLLKRTLLADLQANPSKFSRILGRLSTRTIGRPVSENEIAQLKVREIGFHASGSHKDVFRIDFDLPQHEKDTIPPVSITVAIKSARGTGYIRPEEIQYLRDVNEKTNYDGSQVPIFIESYQFIDANNQNIEAFFEEFVDGKVFNDVIVDEPKRAQEVLLSVASMLFDAYSIRHGSVPTDIHQDNIMIRDSNNQPVLVDAGYVLPQEFEHWFSRILYHYFLQRDYESETIHVNQLQELLNLVASRPTGISDLKKIREYFKGRLEDIPDDNLIARLWESEDRDFLLQTNGITNENPFLSISYMNPSTHESVTRRIRVFDPISGRVVQPIYLNPDLVSHVLPREVVLQVVNGIDQLLASDKGLDVPARSELRMTAQADDQAVIQRQVEFLTQNVRQDFLKNKLNALAKDGAFSYSPDESLETAVEKLITQEGKNIIQKEYYEKLLTLAGSQKIVSDFKNVFRDSTQVSLNEAFEFLTEETKLLTSEEKQVITNEQRAKLLTQIYPLILFSFAGIKRKFSETAYSFHLLGVSLLSIENMMASGILSTQPENERAQWAMDMLVASLSHDLVEDTEINLYDMQDFKEHGIFTRKSIQRIKDLTKEGELLENLEIPEELLKIVKGAFKKKVEALNYRNLRLGPKSLVIKYADRQYNLAETYLTAENFPNDETRNFRDRYTNETTGPDGFLEQLVYHFKLPAGQGWFVHLANRFLAIINQIASQDNELLPEVKSLEQSAGALQEAVGTYVSLDEQLRVIEKILHDVEFAKQIAKHIHDAYYLGQGQEAPEFEATEQNIAVNLAGFYAVEAGVGYLSEASRKTPLQIMDEIRSGTLADEQMLLLARFANATWKASQPFRSLSRITRPIMKPAARLTQDELQLDFDQIRANSKTFAAKIIQELRENGSEPRSELRAIAPEAQIIESDDMPFSYVTNESGESAIVIKYGAVIKSGKETFLKELDNLPGGPYGLYKTGESLILKKGDKAIGFVYFWEKMEPGEVAKQGPERTWNPVNEAVLGGMLLTPEYRKIAGAQLSIALLDEYFRHAIQSGRQDIDLAYPILLPSLALVYSFYGLEPAPQQAIEFDERYGGVHQEKSRPVKVVIGPKVSDQLSLYFPEEFGKAQFKSLLRLYGRVDHYHYLDEPPQYGKELMLNSAYRLKPEKKEELMNRFGKTSRAELRQSERIGTASVLPGHLAKSELRSVVSQQLIDIGKTMSKIGSFLNRQLAEQFFTAGTDGAILKAQPLTERLRPKDQEDLIKILSRIRGSYVGKGMPLGVVYAASYDDVDNAIQALRNFFVSYDNVPEFQQILNGLNEAENAIGKIRQTVDRELRAEAVNIEERATELSIKLNSSKSLGVPNFESGLNFDEAFELTGAIFSASILSSRAELRMQEESNELVALDVDGDGYHVKVVGSRRDKQPVIASGFSEIVRRLMRIADWPSERRLNIQFGGDLFSNGIRREPNGDLFVQMSQIFVRHSPDLSQMTSEQKKQYHIATYEGEHDDKLDEVKIAYVLAHEMAHSVRNHQTSEDRNDLWSLFSLYQIRKQEYEADRDAAIYLLQMGFGREEILAAMDNIFESYELIQGGPVNYLRYSWFRRPVERFSRTLGLDWHLDHPTRRQRIANVIRAIKKEQKHTPVIYERQTFSELAMSYNQTSHAEPLRTQPDVIRSELRSFAQWFDNASSAIEPFVIIGGMVLPVTILIGWLIVKMRKWIRAVRDISHYLEYSRARQTRFAQQIYQLPDAEARRLSRLLNTPRDAMPYYRFEDQLIVELYLEIVLGGPDGNQKDWTPASVVAYWKETREKATRLLDAVTEKIDLEYLKDEVVDPVLGRLPKMKQIEEARQTVELMKDEVYAEHILKSILNAPKTFPGIVYERESKTYRYAPAAKSELRAEATVTEPAPKLLHWTKPVQFVRQVYHDQSLDSRVYQLLIDESDFEALEAAYDTSPLAADVDEQPDYYLWAIGDDFRINFLIRVMTLENGEDYVSFLPVLPHDDRRLQVDFEEFQEAFDQKVVELAPLWAQLLKDLSLIDDFTLDLGLFSVALFNPTKEKTQFAFWPRGPIGEEIQEMPAEKPAEDPKARGELRSIKPLETKVVTLSVRLDGSLKMKRAPINLTTVTAAEALEAVAWELTEEEDAGKYVGSFVIELSTPSGVEPIEIQNSDRDSILDLIESKLGNRDIDFNQIHSIALNLSDEIVFTNIVGALAARRFNVLNPDMIPDQGIQIKTRNELTKVLSDVYAWLSVQKPEIKMLVAVNVHDKPLDQVSHSELLSDFQVEPIEITELDDAQLMEVAADLSAMMDLPEYFIYKFVVTQYETTAGNSALLILSVSLPPSIPQVLQAVSPVTEKRSELRYQAEGTKTQSFDSFSSFAEDVLIELILKYPNLEKEIPKTFLDSSVHLTEDLKTLSYRFNQIGEQKHAMVLTGAKVTKTTDQIVVRWLHKIEDIILAERRYEDFVNAVADRIIGTPRTEPSFFQTPERSRAEAIVYGVILMPLLTSEVLIELRNILSDPSRKQAILDKAAAKRSELRTGEADGGGLLSLLSDVLAVLPALSLVAFTFAAPFLIASYPEIYQSTFVYQLMDPAFWLSVATAAVLVFGFGPTFLKDLIRFHMWGAARLAFHIANSRVRITGGAKPAGVLIFWKDPGERLLDLLGYLISFKAYYSTRYIRIIQDPGELDLQKLIMRPGELLKDPTLDELEIESLLPETRLRWMKEGNYLVYSPERAIRKQIERTIKEQIERASTEKRSELRVKADQEYSDASLITADPLTIRTDLYEFETYRKLKVVEKLTQLIRALERLKPVTGAATEDLALRYRNLRLDLHRYTDEVREIVIFLPRDYFSSSSHIYYMPGKRTFVEVDSKDSDIRQLAADLIKLLQGNEVEDVSPSQLGTNVFPNEYWSEFDDRWETGNAYKDKFHPAISETVFRHLESIQDREIALVDLGGGDGGLIKTIAERAAKDIPAKRMKYFLIERNEKLFSDAQKNLGGLEGATLIREDVAELGNVESLKSVKNKVHVVTASGVLNEGPMSKDDAKRVARQVYENLLIPGGIFILTGWSKVLLNQSDFEAVGFEAVNLSVPANVVNEVQPMQFYILRKSKQVLARSELRKSDGEHVSKIRQFGFYSWIDVDRQRKVREMLLEQNTIFRESNFKEWDGRSQDALVAFDSENNPIAAHAFIAYPAIKTAQANGIVVRQDQRKSGVATELRNELMAYLKRNSYQFFKVGFDKWDDLQRGILASDDAQAFHENQIKLLGQAAQAKRDEKGAIYYIEVELEKFAPYLPVLEVGPSRALSESTKKSELRIDPVEFAWIQEIPGLPAVADLVRILELEQVPLIQAKPGDVAFAFLIKNETIRQFYSDFIRRFPAFFQIKILQPLWHRVLARFAEQAVVTNEELSKEYGNAVILNADAAEAHRALLEQVISVLTRFQEGGVDEIDTLIRQAVSDFIMIFFYSSAWMRSFKGRYSAWDNQIKAGIVMRYSSDRMANSNRQMRQIIESLRDAVKLQQTLKIPGKEILFENVILERLRKHAPRALRGGLTRERLVQYLDRLLEIEKFSEYDPLFPSWDYVTGLKSGDKTLIENPRYPRGDRFELQPQMNLDQGEVVEEIDLTALQPGDLLTVETNATDVYILEMTENGLLKIWMDGGRGYYLLKASEWGFEPVGKIKVGRTKVFPYYKWSIIPQDRDGLLPAGAADWVASVVKIKKYPRIRSELRTQRKTKFEIPSPWVSTLIHLEQVVFNHPETQTRIYRLRISNGNDLEMLESLFEDDPLAKDLEFYLLESVPQQVYLLIRQINRQRIDYLPLHLSSPDGAAQLIKDLALKIDSDLGIAVPVSRWKFDQHGNSNINIINTNNIVPDGKMQFTSAVPGTPGATQVPKSIETKRSELRQISHRMKQIALGVVLAGMLIFEMTRTELKRQSEKQSAASAAVIAEDEYVSTIRQLAEEGESFRLAKFVMDYMIRQNEMNPESDFALLDWIVALGQIVRDHGIEITLNANDLRYFNENRDGIEGLGTLFHPDAPVSEIKISREGIQNPRALARIRVLSGEEYVYEGKMANLEGETVQTKTKRAPDVEADIVPEGIVYRDGDVQSARLALFGIYTPFVTLKKVARAVDGNQNAIVSHTVVSNKFQPSKLKRQLVTLAQGRSELRMFYERTPSDFGSGNSGYVKKSLKEENGAMVERRVFDLGMIRLAGFDNNPDSGVYLRLYSDSGQFAYLQVWQYGSWHNIPKAVFHRDAKQRYDIGRYNGGIGVWKNGEEDPFISFEMEKSQSDSISRRHLIIETIDGQAKDLILRLTDSKSKNGTTVEVKIDDRAHVGLPIERPDVQYIRLVEDGGGMVDETDLQHVGAKANSEALNGASPIDLRAALKRVRIDVSPFVITERNGKYTVRLNSEFYNPLLMNKEEKPLLDEIMRRLTETLSELTEADEGRQLVHDAIFPKGVERLRWFEKVLDHDFLLQLFTEVQHQKFERHIWFNIGDFTRRYLLDEWKLQTGIVVPEILKMDKRYLKYAKQKLLKERPYHRMAMLMKADPETLKIAMSDGRDSYDPNVMVIDSIFKIEKGRPGLPGERVVLAKWKGRVFFLYISRSHTVKESEKYLHTWRSAEGMDMLGAHFIKQPIEGLDDLPPQISILLDEAVTNIIRRNPGVIQSHGKLVQRAQQLGFYVYGLNYSPPDFFSEHLHEIYSANSLEELNELKDALLNDGLISEDDRQSFQDSEHQIRVAIETMRARLSSPRSELRNVRSEAAELSVETIHQLTNSLISELSGRILSQLGIMGHAGLDANQLANHINQLAKSPNALIIAREVAKGVEERVNQALDDAEGKIQDLPIESGELRSVLEKVANLGIELSEPANQLLSLIGESVSVNENARIAAAPVISQANVDFSNTLTDLLRKRQEKAVFEIRVPQNTDTVKAMTLIRDLKQNPWFTAVVVAENRSALKELERQFARAGGIRKGRVVFVSQDDALYATTIATNVPTMVITNSEVQLKKGALAFDYSRYTTGDTILFQNGVDFSQVIAAAVAYQMLGSLDGVVRNERNQLHAAGPHVFTGLEAFVLLLADQFRSALRQKVSA